MLTFSILASFFILLFYIMNKYNKHAKDTITLISLYSLCLVWSIFILIDTERTPIYIEAIILLILVLSFYYLSTLTSIKDLSIINAKQESYWNISPNNIINAFKEHEIEKEDRIEVSASNENLYLNTTDTENIKIISPSAISYFKKLDSIYEAKFINSIDEIKKFPLHQKVFHKISSHLEKDKEIFLDYNSILEELDKNLDLFIINLWDKYSKDFNIGIGQLEAISTKNILDQELINALDNTNLNMIKLKGSYLQYKYEIFKKQGIVKDE